MSWHAVTCQCPGCVNARYEMTLLGEALAKLKPEDWERMAADMRGRLEKERRARTAITKRSGCHCCYCRRY